MAKKDDILAFWRGPKVEMGKPLLRFSSKGWFVLGAEWPFNPKWPGKLCQYWFGPYPTAQDAYAARIST